LSWVPNSFSARHLIAAALLVTASAAAADILVVRSTGPSAKSYPAGKRLPDNARVTLKANDQLVVLDRRGTRTLRGPGSFAAGAASSAPSASAAPVQQRRARIGAVRGAGTGELRSPTIWHVDVTRSSTICLAEPANVTLWRADTSKPMKLNVTRVRDGATRQLNWPTGASTAGWPAAIAVTDGAEFRLSWKGAAAPTLLRFKTLPQKPAGLEDTASSLISNECTAQLDLLIETVRLPDDAPPAG
jgi:hypothetical protein